MGEAVKDQREEVIQAWYMDDSEEDQRLPHHKDPKEFISLDKLAELGVLSWRLDADNYETDEDLKKIREYRGYSYTDFCEVCLEKLPNYEEKVKSFFEEHLHTDEEIRYCVAGSVSSTPSIYFDGLVGMRAHMERMEQLLRLDLDEVRMIGIWDHLRLDESNLYIFLELVNQGSLQKLYQSYQL